MNIPTTNPPPTPAQHESTLAWVQPARALIEDRFAGLPAWVILTQLFIGFGWLRAASEKFIDWRWWTGGVLDDFVAEHHSATLAWYQPFLELVVGPLAPPVIITVVIGQVVAGLCLVTGRSMTLGLAVGMVLNLHFLAAGAVDPSAFYLLAQGALALWLAEHSTNDTNSEALGLAAATGVFFAALCLPLVSTLHPKLVIEDPAMMFTFGGLLTAFVCLVAITSSTGEPPNDPAYIPVDHRARGYRPTS